MKRRQDGLEVDGDDDTESEQEPVRNISNQNGQSAVPDDVSDVELDISDDDDGDGDSGSDIDLDISESVSASDGDDELSESDGAFRLIGNGMFRGNDGDSYSDHPSDDEAIHDHLNHSDQEDIDEVMRDWQRNRDNHNRNRRH